MRVLAALLAAILWFPAFVGAQSSGTVPRIGVLGGGYLERGDFCLDAFRTGLREAGYVEGRTIVVEPRFSEGNTKPWPPLVADLLKMKVDVIVTAPTSAALAAKQVTTTVPIVMAAGPYPVESGLVASLARPGGNVTGSTNETPELTQKRVELLRDAVPKAKRMAAFRRTGGATGPVMNAMIANFQSAAKRLGIQLTVIDVQRPEELDRAFQAAVESRTQAIVLPSSPFFHGSQLSRIAALGLRHKLPVLSADVTTTGTDIFMQFGAGTRDSCARAAVFVDKILKGAKPADLPVEQPTRIAMIVNLKTAKAIGVNVPRSITARADRVIE